MSFNGINGFQQEPEWLKLKFLIRLRKEEEEEKEEEEDREQAIYTRLGAMVCHNP